MRAAAIEHHPSYRAVAERGRRGWNVRLEGLNGSEPKFEARDLSDIEPRAAKVIWGYTGRHVVAITTEVVLPGVIQDHLAIIGQHCDDIDHEYGAVFAALAEMGVPRLDIVRVLELHYRAPRRLTITNAEIVEHGLSLDPDAIGIEWDDKGFALTRLCRYHVDATRHTYRDLDPAGINALVYPDQGFQCDLCIEGDEPEHDATCRTSR